MRPSGSPMGKGASRCEYVCVRDVHEASEEQKQMGSMR